MDSPPTLRYPGWSADTVTVPVNYFEEGRLPAVCVVTGAPATSNLRRRYSTTPGWVGCLFFVSWLALLGVQGRVVDDGFGTRWVQLRGVHPAFSRALAVRLGR